MHTLESTPDVEFILSELRDEMAAAQVRAAKRLAALGVQVEGRIADELEAEAEELREWVDRARTAVGVGSFRDEEPGAPNRYTPENPSDRP
jgi:hypothetical protein